ncbi:MAG: hypothetical protein ACRDTH_21685 [Pseudonocardiaceae bacterium]
MIDVPQHHHKPQHGRLTAIARSTDDGSHTTLLAVHEVDESRMIHGLGAPGVAKSDLTLAESLLMRAW